MEKIIEESELVKIIQEDIRKTDKQSVQIFAGHLPLLYHDEGPGKRSVEFGVDRWGEFSTYTFDLGCQVLKYAHEQGKDSKLMVIVDDDVELPMVEKLDEKTGKVRYVHKDASWRKAPRKRAFMEATIPDAYQQILDKYGLSKDDLITQERSGKEVPLISEKKLKIEAKRSGNTASNECSIAYKGLLLNEKYFDKQTDFLVSFMPGQCKGNIFDGFLEERTDIIASHMFFPHIESLGGFIQGLGNSGDPMTIDEMYSGGIFYHKSVSK